MSATRYNAWLWALLGIYAATRASQMFPGAIPMVVVVALHVLPPLTFAVAHGARVYRLRGILTFIMLSFGIGNFFENLGDRMCRTKWCCQLG